MDSFIFNDYTKRLLNGEVNSSQVWNFLPVNRKFVETFENCSSLNFKQFRTTADIACYSADGVYEHRENYIKNEREYNNEINKFYDVVSDMSGLVTATYSQIKYVKDSDTKNKPLYIDNTISEEDLKSIYGIELNDTHRYYKNSGFYYVTKVSELNWLADRCNRNNTFTICLGDIISEENITTPIGTYEYPFQGIFDGAGYIFSSCNIDVNKDINGVIGVLGDKGIVKNVRIQDMSFSSDNLLNTSYMQKYNNDIVAGFVAKNYGQVYDVSSIGDNYIYGLSPAIYSIKNPTDEIGEYKGTYKYKPAYVFDIENSDTLFQDSIRRYYVDEGLIYDDGKINKVNNFYLIDNNDNPIKLNDDDYIIADCVFGGMDSDTQYEIICDWVKSDNGEYHTYEKKNATFSDLIKKCDRFEDISYHYNQEYYIYTFSGGKNDFKNEFKNHRYYYNVDNVTCDLHYVTIKKFEYDTSTKTLSAYAKDLSHKDSNDDSNSERKKLLQYLNESHNFYNESNVDNKSVNNSNCYDYKDLYRKNINPYIGYFHSTRLTDDCSEGFENHLKFTYLISPIIGSNYNIVSSCLNNSNVYFGINKNEDYNKFVGEFGGIAGYSESIVCNNSSNIVIKNSKNDKYRTESKIFTFYSNEENSSMDFELLDKIYGRQLDYKNNLIMGNIIGRCNLYNDSCTINNNISNLIIENSSHLYYDNDYYRPSSLVGSMYVNICLSSVSSYKSIISGNSSYIDNKDTNVSSTYYFNELFLNLNPEPNTYHYDERSPSPPNLESLTSIEYINKSNNEIREIVNKFDKINEYSGKCYKNFKITISSPDYITPYMSYLTYNDHLKHCSYENENSTTYTITHKNMSYNLESTYEIDKGFDVRRLMLKEDYTGVSLSPLSAKVEFDYNDINFKIIESENNLYWGTSADPKEELKSGSTITGDVINSKDFAGVLIYDNDGNLIGYENNYNTNVLYNTYSMTYNSGIIMEIK